MSDSCEFSFNFICIMFLMTGLLLRNLFKLSFELTLNSLLSFTLMLLKTLLLLGLSVSFH